MKKTSKVAAGIFIVITAFWGLRVLAASEATAITQLESADQIEKKIIEKISQNIGVFLDKNDYRIFANAKVKTYREKIILEGEEEKLSKGRQKKQASPQGLPGFENLEKNAARAQKIDQTERAKYAYKKTTKLLGVGIRMIVEESLPQEVRALAKSTTENVIQNNLGKLGSLEFVEMSLKRHTANSGHENWFSKYLFSRGDDAIDLAYVALLIVVVLAALFAVWYSYYKKFRPRQTLQQAMAEENQKRQATDTKSENLLQGHLDRLIALINDAPLISRNFLQNLEDDDKQALYSSQRTPAMQAYFRKLLKLNVLDVKKMTTEETNEFLSRVLNDLERFIRLNKETVGQAFGYVAQLSPQAVREFLEGQSQKAEVLLVLAPYLSEFQLSELTRSLTIDEKAQFIGSLHGSHTVDSLFKAEIEQQLRDLYQNIRSDAAVDVADNASIETLFLESDVNCVEVVKLLAKRYDKVPKAYEKYLVTFEDLFNLDLGISKAVFQKVSNQVLTQALMDKDFDSKIKSRIGDIRSQLIESMKSSGERNRSEQAITDAQNEVLKVYRRLV